MSSNSSKKYRNVVIKNTFLFAALVLLLVLAGCSSGPSCTKTDYLDASVTVKMEKRAYLGLNADTDGLRFGRVPPSASAKRTLSVKYSQDALVLITMEGDLASWTSITPSEFFLPANETKDVALTVNVPPDAREGDYFSRTKLCFREK